MKKMKMSAVLLLMVGVIPGLKPASGSIASLTLTNDPLYAKSDEHVYEYDEHVVPGSGPAARGTGNWDTTTYAVVSRVSSPSRQSSEVSEQPLFTTTPKQKFEDLFKGHRLKDGGMSAITLRTLEPLVQSVDAQVQEMERYQDAVTPVQREKVKLLVVEFNGLLDVLNALLFGRESEKSTLTRRRTNGNIKKIDETILKLAEKQGEVKSAINLLIEPYKAGQEAARREEEKKLFATAEQLNDLLLLKFLRETRKAQWNSDYSRLSVHEKDARELASRPLTPDTQRRITERLDEVRARAAEAAVRLEEESYRHGSFAVPHEEGRIHIWSPTHSL